jgi:hypothetical protein
MNCDPAHLVTLSADLNDKWLRGKYFISDHQKPVNDSCRSAFCNSSSSHTPPLSRGRSRSPAGWASFSIHRRGTEDRSKLRPFSKPPPLECTLNLSSVIGMVLTCRNECLQTTGCQPTMTLNFHHLCIPGETSHDTHLGPMHGRKYRYASPLMGEGCPERLLPTQQYP